tara:strand:- start:1326 stop:1559 length:234 start_codon:yes stop_codon:yes gene_type:complete
MSKQSIFVRHKDEILTNLINYLDDIAGRLQSTDFGLQSEYEDGYTTALKWVLGLEETEKEEELPFQPIPNTEDENNE